MDDRRLDVFHHFYEVPSAADPKVWAWFLAMMDSASLSALVSGITEMCNWDLTKEVQKISMKATRIFHGEEDKLVPFEFAEKQHNLINDSELVRFKNGHLLFYNERNDLSSKLIWWLENR